jgi:hypothetical protein
MSPWQVALVAAVISVGIRCIRRSGELAKLNEDQIVVIPTGAKLVVGPTKADQAARMGLEVPFEAGVSLADPIRCLDEYLQIAKGSSLRGWQGRPGVPLFVGPDRRPLDAGAVKDMVRLVAAHAGLRGEFGGHSIRISGASLAILGGMSLEQVMAIGGWKSQAVLNYLRGLVAMVMGASTRMGL